MANRMHFILILDLLNAEAQFVSASMRGSEPEILLMRRRRHAGFRAGDASEKKMRFARNNRYPISH